MKHYFTFQLLSPGSWNSLEAGERLIKMWIDEAPQLIPDRFGVNEPLRHKFDATQMCEVMQFWTSSSNIMFNKRNRNIKYYSYIMNKTNNYQFLASWIIGIETDHLGLDQFYNMLRRSASMFVIDFGYFHQSTEIEAECSIATNTFISANIKGHPSRGTRHVSIHVLRKFIPDLFWLTLWGAPYVRLFSKERLLSAPAHRVEELPNGSVMIQLTNDPGDVEMAPGEFLVRKTAVKEHLGLDAFFDPVLGPDYQYRVPDFSVH